MSLIAKVTLAVSVLLTLAMAPFCYLNVRAMKQLLHEQTVTRADNISETLLKTTHSEMLHNDRAKVYRMIREAGSQKGIEHIRLITKDGTIIFSTDQNEIGTILDKTAAACDMCHSAERPLREVSSMNRSRVFHDATGIEVLGLTKAVYNQESCSTAPCHFHPADMNILGVLDTVLSLEGVRTKTWEYSGRLFSLTFAMVLAIGASITLLVQHLINRPVKELLEHTKRVGELHLASRAPVRSGDEIGELARSFNDMTQRLQTGQRQLEDWGHTLEAKVEERTQQLQSTQNQLLRSEKLASLGELVAGIAHELNNPLTGILVIGSLLQKRAGLDPEVREDLDIVVHESNRCARIVKGLLDFSRVTTPQVGKVKVNEIMDQAVTLIGTQTIFHDVVFERQCASDVPDVMADANQLEQVFVNILLNAGQAMPEGGTLTLRTLEEGTQVRIDIEDTGHGIPAELLGKVFDPFYTTKEESGTGLGLSVSYGIIENHGGSIEVSSEIGKGTRFSIRLPACSPNGVWGVEGQTAA